ncbi:hypothetical protein A3Q56_04045 [Intoshia linei]|uniref:NOC3-like protein n=1 Tax=Intoshia linei TaxID=1819745 RepID=A0A177B257_9BILA|nr:hypothetical protein A3Q56_04045 [Intoshia linei]
MQVEEEIVQSLPIKKQNNLIYGVHKIKRTAELAKLTDYTIPIKSLRTNEPENKNILQIIDLHSANFQYFIAKLSTLVVQDPHVNIPKLSKFFKILEYCLKENCSILNRDSFKKIELILYSLLQIFCEILPEYKISIDTEEILSKKVKERHQYEKTLSKCLKDYLDILEYIVQYKYNKNLIYIELLQVCCIKCLGQLIITKMSSYNWKKPLIGVFFKKAMSKKKVRHEVCLQIEKLFSLDNDGFITYMLTVQISNFLKRLNYQIPDPEIINTILSIKKENARFRDVAKKKKMKLTKKEQIRERKMKQLNRELEIAGALKFKNSHKMASDTLDALVYLYFKILKNVNAKDCKTISTTLVGINRIVDRFDIKFINPLLELMENFIILNPINNGPICLKLIFAILTQNSGVLCIEPIKFYSHLYNVLIKSNSSSDLLSTLQSIEILVENHNKSMSSSYLLQILEELCSLTLLPNTESSLLVMFMINKIIKMESRAHLILENSLKSGYTQYGDVSLEAIKKKFERSHMWELNLLQNHYNPQIREIMNITSQLNSHKILTIRACKIKSMCNLLEYKNFIHKKP